MNREVSTNLYYKLLMYEKKTLIGGQQIAAYRLWDNSRNIEYNRERKQVVRTAPVAASLLRTSSPDTRSW